MELNELNRTKRLASIDLTWHQVLIAALVVLCLMQTAFLLVKGITVRTVLTPPEIKRSMWIEADKASNEYLEEMSNFLVQMVLNSSGLSAEYQGGLLQKYACAGAIGALDVQMRENAQRLRRDNASTMFAPREWNVDASTNKVFTRGEFSVFVGDKRISNASKTYLLQYTIQAGRLCIAYLDEANDQDPWNPPPKESGNNAAGRPAVSGGSPTR